MGRILIVEDDPDIAELVRHYLARAGHEAEVVASGVEALPRIRDSRPDLLILDLMLPGIHGLEVCRLLRADAETRDLPIIILTARAGESDRVVGFELGADDYITKPFSPKELVARVAALLRRAGRKAATPTETPAALAYGPIAIDRERHVVSDQGREVRLTAKEFLLLQYLVERRGRLVSRDRALSDVWGYQYTGGTRTVDVHVRRLREKLPLLVTALITVKQFGYKLADPVPAAQPGGAATAPMPERDH